MTADKSWMTGGKGDGGLGNARSLDLGVLEIVHAGRRMSEGSGSCGPAARVASLVPGGLRCPRSARPTAGVPDAHGRHRSDGGCERGGGKADDGVREGGRIEVSGREAKV